jgi:hypothetical protein
MNIMNKKLAIGIVPLVAIAAFAVMPVAAQGAGTHWYKNSIKIKEYPNVETTKTLVVGWGKLEWKSSGGSWTCQNAIGANDWNPEGGGAGREEITLFAPYDCSLAVCPYEARVIALGLPWSGELEEPESGVSRLKIKGITVEVGCWLPVADGGEAPYGTNLGSETSGGTLKEAEEGKEGAPGESSPKTKAGTSGCDKPGELTFGAGSGHLLDKTRAPAEHIEDETTGTLKSCGLTESELISSGT